MSSTSHCFTSSGKVILYDWKNRSYTYDLKGFGAMGNYAGKYSKKISNTEGYYLFIRTTKKDMEDMKADQEARTTLWKMSPQAFHNHPIMVAAKEKLQKALIDADVGLYSLEGQKIHDEYLKETGVYWWKPGTQFVPGVGTPSERV